MIVNKGLENIELRIKNEFNYLQSKYPTLAFNAVDWGGKPNVRSQGKNILLATESIISIPKNYDANIIGQYDAMITYSAKFKADHPELRISTTPINATWEGYHWLDDFKGYDDKIKGVCSLHTLYNFKHPLDRNFMKHQIMSELTTEPHLLLHTYGRYPFGKKESYRGFTGHGHSQLGSLQKINEYLFCVAVESTTDPYWGHNFMNERVFNTFKSKTILVYYGATNVEELLPDHIFVNIRKFPTMVELSEYLIVLSQDKKRYTEMVEEAYRWNLTTKLGDIREHEQLWQQAIRENPL